MKSFKSFGTLILFIIPVILLGYQNCGNIENASISQNDHSDDKTFYPPILFNSLDTLNISTEEICAMISTGPIIMFNIKAHICVEAKTICEVAALEDNGYKDDAGKTCSEATNYNSVKLNQSFSDSTASAEGYTTYPQSTCTADIQNLVKIQTRTCILARDGCQASYLKNQKGFIKDPASFCE